MARALDARLRKLEMPSHATLASYRFLKACHEALCRWDNAPTSTDAELWSMAEAEARTGDSDVSAALVALWEKERESHDRA